MCFCIAGSDYLATMEVMELEPDDSQASVLVPLLNDRVLENTETFSVDIGLVPDSMGVQIGAINSVVIEITDDDCKNIRMSLLLL